MWRRRRREQLPPLPAQQCDLKGNWAANTLRSCQIYSHFSVGEAKGCRIFAVKIDTENTKKLLCKPPYTSKELNRLPVFDTPI